MITVHSMKVLSWRTTEQVAMPAIVAGDRATMSSGTVLIFQDEWKTADSVWDIPVGTRGYRFAESGVIEEVSWVNNLRGVYFFDSREWMSQEEIQQRLWIPREWKGSLGAAGVVAMESPGEEHQELTPDLLEELGADSIALSLRRGQKFEVVSGNSAL